MRVENWSLVLADKIEEWRHRSFEYGTADCWQFVGDVVSALTGADYRDLFPRYESRLGAVRILRSSGGMRGLAIKALGEPKPIAQAFAGDVVLGHFGRGLTAGICEGVHCWAQGERGLVNRKTAECVAAWEI